VRDEHDDPTGADLEYDLAHEEIGAPGGDKPPVERGRPAVVTDTPSYHGDYSYDLAHDIPGR
jgi:hypothetical protein